MKSLLFVVALTFSVSSFAKDYVCYGIDGQTVVMNDGSSRREGTASFTVSVKNEQVEIISIKGTNYQEIGAISEFDLLNLKDSTDSDMILISKRRNFSLKCQLD